MSKCRSRDPSRFNSGTTIFLLIYINDLSDNLTSNPNLFADDTSLFSVINDEHPSAKLSLLVNFKNQLISPN